MRRVPRGHNRIHNQHLASRPKRAVACLKNPRRRVVVPVVKDVLHDDRVGTRWQFFEEVAAFDSHSAGDASTSECRCGTSRNMRKIEKYSTHRLVAVQNGGQQQTVSARNVHQRLDSFEVVRVGCCSGLRSADRCHRVVEDCGDFGIPREMFKYRNVEDMIERRHARLHAIAKLSPGPPRAVMSDKTRVTCKALRMVISKQLSHARKLEPAVTAFNEQAHARECSKEAEDPRFWHPSFPGNFARPPPPLRELFRDSDFDDSAECLTDPL